MAHTGKINTSNPNDCNYKELMNRVHRVRCRVPKSPKNGRCVSFYINNGGLR